MASQFASLVWRELVKISRAVWYALPGSAQRGMAQSRTPYQEPPAEVVECFSDDEPGAAPGAAPPVLVVPRVVIRRLLINVNVKNSSNC